MKIFVTVGTHEQQFNRLIKEIDEISKRNEFDVFAQVGYSDYTPNHIEWSKLLTFEEMSERIEWADIIITHGGPASFISVLVAGKTPIVVPRYEKYSEHVNDHQVEFVEFLEKNGEAIIPVYEIENLYDQIVFCSALGKNKEKKFVSNNHNFVSDIEEKIEALFEQKR